MLSKAIIKLNNSLLRVRRPKCKPVELLVLIPSCLQNSKCPQRVSVDVANCKRCGKCLVDAVMALGDEYGVRIACATGGRLALEMVKSDTVKGVVAVACEKELRAGVIGGFPKPILTVANSRPNGPCKDTAVAIEDVREAIEYLLGTKPTSEKA
jgi:uncharacterized protein